MRHRLGHKQYQSKHYHDQFGPFFEDPLNTTGTLQIGFHEGTESILNCRVGMLKDKTVMWVRRTFDKVSLLTVGNVTYSGDPRIKVMFIYPNNWRLSVRINNLSIDVEQFMTERRKKKDKKDKKKCQEIIRQIRRKKGFVLKIKFFFCCYFSI